jgi:hypothetical protein
MGIKLRYLQRNEKNSTEKKKAERMYGLLSSSQKKLNEVLQWSLRVMDRNLVRNAGSYVWSSDAPDSWKKAAKDKGHVSAFENLEPMAASLKKSSLEVMREVNIVDDRGIIKYTSPDDGSGKRKFAPDRFLKKKFIHLTDMVSLALNEDCDFNAGESTTALLMNFSDSPTVKMGEDLMQGVGPALESRLGESASDWDRAKEVYESMEKIPGLKTRVTTLLQGTMATELESWSDRTLRDVMGVDRCTKELEEVKKSSRAFAKNSN